MTRSTPPALSVLDLVTVSRRGSVRDALEGTVALARCAEARGYRRVWYAEHHNMATIASSATAVVIAHVAAHTEEIRLGAGGVMLPNHSPLVIAEQFGTLATLHPGRIDLGLGRAPGTDQRTLRALRRDPLTADSFPQDVVELQGYLGDATRVAGVNAVPGRGTHVPLYILGSSLFGAQLAALLGLPYGFASHFAPAALQEAVALYRREFRPSEQQAVPYVIAGVNVIVDHSEDEAQAQLVTVRRARAGLFLGRGPDLDDDEADRLLASPRGRHVAEMMRHTAAGTPPSVADQLEEFAAYADADELIVVPASPGVEGKLRTLDLLADAMEMSALPAAGRTA